MTEARRNMIIFLSPAPLFDLHHLSISYLSVSRPYISRQPENAALLLVYFFLSTRSSVFRDIIL